MPRAHASNSIRLAITGHRQTDDYSCGALAGWSVVELFNRKPDFRSFYNACAPSKRWGTSTAKLRAALRKHGVTVSTRRNLEFPAIRASIEQGWPILLSISTRTEQFWHWVVIYGVSWNPQQVFISAPLPGRCHKEVVPWRTFQRHWRPCGFGLVCRPKPQKQAKAATAEASRQHRLRAVPARLPRRKPAA